MNDVPGVLSRAVFEVLLSRPVYEVLLSRPVFGGAALSNHVAFEVL